MRRYTSGGGWPAIWYSLRKARRAGGFFGFYKALRSKNTCKTCALGMGGQLGGMVNEIGHFPEVCKKSIQAMAADMQGAIHSHFFADFSIEKLRGFSPLDLENAGRITRPLVAGPLDSQYREITWDEALDRIAAKLRKTPPEESSFYLSGRASNEAGYLAQLFARAYGTNNIHSCSFYCHQASGVALASVTGSGTATVTLEDLPHADLLILVGANPASNHPRLMRTFIELKRNGGRIIVINPIRETGLVQFRVPSDVRSMLFGSKIADEYVQPHIGGDVAIFSAIAKSLLEQDAVDRDYLANYTDGFEAVEEHLRDLSSDALVHACGVPKDEIEHIARVYAGSKRTIFCWAMGLTHHENGTENVQALALLALLRGMVGKPGAGLLPLRGHSNVQGIGSIGAVPNLKPAVAAAIERSFKITLPTSPGLDTMACMHRAMEGRMRFAWCQGGNLYGSNPDAAFASRAMRNIDTVVYLSTTLNTGHVHGMGRETIILPVLPRDEEPQATTQESMFNFVRLSDGGPPRHDGPRSEGDVIIELARRVLPNHPTLNWNELARYETVRRYIAETIPGYEAIADIDRTKAEFTIAGRTLHEPRFPTDTGRAKCHIVPLPQITPLDRNQLRLMTIRSEGQFNTVVYENEDVYRNQDRRNIIMMSEGDRVRMNLALDQPVTVHSSAGSLSNVLVRVIDIREGNAAMYYPEANVLVPGAVDGRSGTPAYKNVLVNVDAAI